MSRPVKNIVDYFPHDSHASSGKTLTILFNEFGHIGISVWWQLLEIISTTDNHVIACRNSIDYSYLAGKLRVSIKEMTGILHQLAQLNAIDLSLLEAGYIWSDNFISGISAVYKNRKQKIPEKPLVSTTDNPISLKEMPVSTTDNPQSIVKYSKEKNRKKRLTSYTPEELKTSDWYKRFLKEYPSFNDKEFNHALTWLEEHPGRKLNKSFLINWAKKLPAEIFIPGKLDKL